MDGLAIHMDSTRAAQTGAAAVFAAGQSQGIAQQPQQGHFSGYVYSVLPSIDI